MSEQRQMPDAIEYTALCWQITRAESRAQEMREELAELESRLQSLRNRREMIEKAQEGGR